MNFQLICLLTESVLLYSNGDIAPTWTAVGGSTYRATVFAISEPHCRSIAHHHALSRLPVYQRDNKKVVMHVVAKRRYVLLNNSCLPESIDAAARQTLIVKNIFCSHFHLSLSAFDPAATESLLLSWEQTPVQVTELSVRPCMDALLSSQCRRSGHNFTALEDVSSLTVQTSSSMVEGLSLSRHFPHLESLTAISCSVSSTRLLCKLISLTTLNLSKSNLRESDLHPLSCLPRLHAIDVSYCCQLTSLHPLAKCQSLRRITAACCSSLMHVWRLGDLPHLAFLDLSSTLLQQGELSRLLTRPLPILEGRFNHLSWPREGPPPLPTLAAVRRLDLRWTALPRVEWLFSALQLETLYLDHSSITETQVKQLLSRTMQLVTLSLRNCDYLQTDLSFVLQAPQLPPLQAVWISQQSLRIPPSSLEALQRIFPVVAVSDTAEDWIY